MKMKQTAISFALPIAFFLVFATIILPIFAYQTERVVPPSSIQRFELTISWFDCDNTTGGGYVTATYANFYTPLNGYEFSGANYWGFVYYQVNPVVVDVLAHPTDGWFLQSWTLDGVDIGNSTEIVVTTGCGLVMSLVAMFNPLGTPPPTYSSYTLTINSGSCNNETLPSDCTTTPSSGVHVFTQTTMVTANAGTGWLFNNWIMDGQPVGDSTNNPINVSFDSKNHTLTAVFNPIPVTPPAANYTLTISKEAGGNNKFAFGETDPAIGVYVYPANTRVNVTVIPYAEWYLEKWIFDGKDYANTTTFQVLMNANHTLVAVFVPPRLAADVNGDGTVDTVDAGIVVEAFMSKPGDSNWNPIADLNHDGIVDMYDLIMVARDFGKTL
jgi:Dockerin type I domain/Divergent InlB B-repeat domain